jgi:hypothetical protein
MYNDTYFELNESRLKDFYENEMQRTKENALRSLSKVVHFEIESISRVLAYSFFEENEDAIKLADKLNLCRLDFLACIDDIEGFREIYYRDLKLAQNF